MRKYDYLIIGGGMTAGRGVETKAPQGSLRQKLCLVSVERGESQMNSWGLDVRELPQERGT